MATDQAYFDPFTQPITILQPDQTPMNITIDDIQDLIAFSANVSINYGSQIGASLILLIVLLLITKAEKRHSMVFILNTIALLLNFIRCVVISLYCTGPWWNWYSQLTGDFENVPKSQYATSIAGVVLTFLLVVCIEISLVMQVHVVCVTATAAQKLWILAASLTVSMLAVGFQFADMVLNARQIVTQMSGPADNMVASATNICVTISICFFSLIFTLKLGHSIMERRKLGLKRFGPMQIIFIMGCQTLIVPVIFCGIQYKANLIPQASSLVPTVVALFSPLSSIWASASIDGNVQPKDSPHAHHNRSKKPSFGSSGHAALFDKLGSGSRKSSAAERVVSWSSPLSSPGRVSRSQEYDMEEQVGRRFGGGDIELSTHWGNGKGF